MTNDKIRNLAWNIFPISDQEKNANFIVLLVHFAKLIIAEDLEEICSWIEEEMSANETAFNLVNFIRERAI
jgi:hypothetical protein